MRARYKLKPKCARHFNTSPIRGKKKNSKILILRIQYTRSIMCCGKCKRKEKKDENDNENVLTRREKTIEVRPALARAFGGVFSSRAPTHGARITSAIPLRSFPFRSLSPFLRVLHNFRYRTRRLRALRRRKILANVHTIHSLYRV